MTRLAACLLVRSIEQLCVDQFRLSRSSIQATLVLFVIFFPTSRQRCLLLSNTLNINLYIEVIYKTDFNKVTKIEEET